MKSCKFSCGLIIIHNEWCRTFKNWLPSLFYEDTWAKLGFHRPILELGWRVPCTYPSLNLEILSMFEGEANTRSRMLGLKWSLIKPKVKEFWPWHVPQFEELGFKVAPSFYTGLKLSVSNSDRKRRFKALQKRRLGLELKTDNYAQ